MQKGMPLSSQDGSASVMGNDDSDLMAVIDGSGNATA